MQLDKSLLGPYDNLDDANEALRKIGKLMDDLECKLKRMYQMLLEND